MIMMMIISASSLQEKRNNLRRDYTCTTSKTRWGFVFGEKLIFPNYDACDQVIMNFLHFFALLLGKFHFLPDISQPARVHTREAVRVGLYLVN